MFGSSVLSSVFSGVVLLLMGVCCFSASLLGSGVVILLSGFSVFVSSGMLLVSGLVVGDIVSELGCLSLSLALSIFGVSGVLISGLTGDIAVGFGFISMGLNNDSLIALVSSLFCFCSVVS